jgi:hypothetical protein
VSLTTRLQLLLALTCLTTGLVTGSATDSVAAVLPVTIALALIAVRELTRRHLRNAASGTAAGLGAPATTRSAA